MYLRALLLLSVLCIGACKYQPDNDMAQTIDAYLATYAERQDFESFLSFYSEDVVLEDIISGERIVSKSALKDFFDWNNPAYHKIEESTLIVQSITIEKNKAVVEGYFTAFKWGDSVFEAMHFVSMFTLNDKNKITQQTDWINYPNTLVDFATRKNANDWIE